MSCILQRNTSLCLHCRETKLRCCLLTFALVTGMAGQREVAGPITSRSSLSQRLQSQELGQYSWVRTSTLGAIAHLFIPSHDARLLGVTGSQVSSGQSACKGKPLQASPLCGKVIDVPIYHPMHILVTFIIT
jgi:hypothetical protein